MAANRSRSRTDFARRTDVRKGQITVQEAGRIGGEIRKQELGHEGYVKLSKLGSKKGAARTRDLIRKGREAEERGLL